MMKKIQLFFVLLFCSSMAYAEVMKQMVFFGDSLTDNGNLYHYLKVIPKSPPYYNGEFSNGPVWADVLSKTYPKVEYANYAVGGATVVLRGPLQDSLPVNLREEVQDYLIRTKSSDRSHTLFAIWIGANDYMVSDSEDINVLTNQVIDSTIDTVHLLMDHGANMFMLVDLPNMSKVPYYLEHADESDRVRLLSQLHHEKMIAAIQQLKAQNPDRVFIYIDAYSTFDDISAYIDTYNQKYNTHITITNSANGCWLGGYTLRDTQALSDALQRDLQKNAGLNKDNQAWSTRIMQTPALQTVYALQSNADVVPCDNPDEHLFWDLVHPTAVVHRVFADIVKDKLIEAGVLG